MLLPTRSLPTRSPSVPIGWGHVVIRASSSGKPVINRMSMKAVTLGDVDMEVGRIYVGK
jgi:hypothetical protein